MGGTIRSIQEDTNMEGRPCASSEAELKESLCETSYLDEERPHIGDNIDAKGGDAKANHDGISTLDEAKATDEDNLTVNEALAANTEMPTGDDNKEKEGEDYAMHSRTAKANKKVGKNSKKRGRALETARRRKGRRMM